MKTIRFMTNCPGCGDKHFGIECKKPTQLTPTMAQVFCTECESTVLVKVSLLKARENRSQIQFTPVKIKASPKLISVLQDREERRKVVEQEKEMIAKLNDTTELQVRIETDKIVNNSEINPNSL